jgi:hypothetical protein
MTVARWLPLTLLVAMSCAVACVGAACTTGTTPICDDAGTCLISEPPDGRVVGDGAGPGSEAGEGGAEAGSEPSPEAAPQEAAASEGGDGAADGAGG